MRALQLFIISALLILASACSTTDAERYTTEADLYEAAQQQIGRNQWELAISNLRKLEENFPFGVYAEQAQLELLYAHYMFNEADAAIATADRFIRLHPQHRNVDYAHYMKGLASFTKGQGVFERIMPTDLTRRDPGAARESLSHFTQLISRYPDSPYAPDARKRMQYLRNLLARYEIHVANYYFKRGAYLAATMRGRHVLENYHLSPAMPDALAVMALGYALMGIDDMSQHMVDVLRLNYPDYPALREDGGFDHGYSLDPEERSWVSILTLGLFDKGEPAGFDTRERYDPQYQTEPPPRPGQSS